MIKTLKETSNKLKEIDKLVQTYGEPILYKKDKRIRLYKFKSSNVAYILDNTKNIVIPKISIFYDMEYGYEESVGYFNYLVMKRDYKKSLV